MLSPQAKHPYPRTVMPSPQAKRSVRFEEADEPVETPIYARGDLPAGANLTGPAIVEQLDSTTVVPPGWSLRVDTYGNLSLAAGPTP